MLGADPVERCPDSVSGIAVLATCERDLGTNGQHDFGLGAAAGCYEIAAVDHRCGQRAAIDETAVARMPRRAGMGAIEIAGHVTHQFVGIAPFDQRQPLGQQSLQFDRSDLGAILLTLRSALRLLVVVEFAFDPLGGAVEQVDRRPEQIVEIRFQPRIGKRADQRIEDVGDGASDAVALGQRARIGFVLEWSEAVELQLVEDLGGR